MWHYFPSWHLIPVNLQVSFLTFILFPLLTCDNSVSLLQCKVTGFVLLIITYLWLNHNGPNPILAAQWPESPFYIWPEPKQKPNFSVEKAACVRIKGCICWPVCAQSWGLGDYVHKGCTWCFRLSFSPPLPPIIPLPSPSLLLLWPFPTLPWDF